VLDPATLETVCSAPENPATETDVENFVFLFHAILRRREVRFVYSKIAPGAAPETRTVHPLHLVIFADSCVLVAHDPECNDRRNFALTSVGEPQVTGQTFTPPEGFDLKAYLAGGMGPFLGEARHEIRLRFAPLYASRVRKRPWHASQLLIELPDGSAETTYRVAHTAIIEQRVLAAAGQVEVLGPPDLRARIKAAAQAVLEKHS
jgi:proteasome accessory factor C